MSDRRKKGFSESCPSDDCGDLRCLVAVKNTVKRLERDINAEIMAAFAQPVSYG